MIGFSSTELSSCQVLDSQDLQATAHHINGEKLWWSEAWCLFTNYGNNKEYNIDKDAPLSYRLEKKVYITKNINPYPSINYKSSFMWLISIPTPPFLVSSIKAENSLPRALFVGRNLSKVPGTHGSVQAGVPLLPWMKPKGPLFFCEWQKNGEKDLKRSKIHLEINMQPKKSPHPGKGKIIFQASIIMFHVNLPGCNTTTWTGTISQKYKTSNVSRSFLHESTNAVNCLEFQHVTNCKSVWAFWAKHGTSGWWKKSG